jgi:hypothetical protein
MLLSGPVLEWRRVAWEIKAGRMGAMTSERAAGGQIGKALVVATPLRAHVVKDDGAC